MATASIKEFEELSFYDYFAECKIRVKRASANLHAWSVGRSILPSLGLKLLFVFPLTNAQEKNVVKWFGKCET